MFLPSVPKFSHTLVVDVTVHGDAVELAARAEALLNQSFGWFLILIHHYDVLGRPALQIRSYLTHRHHRCLDSGEVARPL